MGARRRHRKCELGDADTDLTRLALPAGWIRPILAPGHPLRPSPTGSQLLGAIEEDATQQLGVGVWSRDGQLCHFWDKASSATWVAESRLLLASANRGLSYELIDSETGAPLNRLCVEGPESIAGIVLSTAPDGRHCGAELYSGQSEVGFSVLRMGEPMLRLIDVEYLSGESALSGVAFSHDGRLAAFGMSPSAPWWCPGDLDAEYDTPSPGGIVEWAWLYLLDLVRGTVDRIALTTVLPVGWMPDKHRSNAGPPSALALLPGERIRIGVPWLGNLELTVGGSERLMVPGPFT
jgi:hypothetical protein